MPTEALSLFAKITLAIGIAICVAAGVWSMFAQYAADRRLARRAHHWPILTLRIVLEHPETCLVPFVLQHAGLLFCIPAILHFLRWFAAMRSGAM